MNHRSIYIYGMGYSCARTALAAEEGDLDLIKCLENPKWLVGVVERLLNPMRTVCFSLYGCYYFILYIYCCTLFFYYSYYYYRYYCYYYYNNNDNNYCYYQCDDQGTRPRTSKRSPGRLRRQAGDE